MAEKWKNHLWTLGEGARLSKVIGTLECVSEDLKLHDFNKSALDHALGFLRRVDRITMECCCDMKAAAEQYNLDISELPLIIGAKATN